MTSLPLVVDLDGTLVRTDMLHESAVRLLGSSPLSVLAIPVWLLQGKAHLKAELAARTSFSPEVLPYQEEFLQWLRAEHARGRQLVLCTASHRSVAEAIAAHLGIFSEVMASDGSTNLAGPRKAAALVARFGRQGFDYAGNSAADLAVWAEAADGVVVDATPRVRDGARACHPAARVFSSRRPSLAERLGTVTRALRVHQWLKNLLIFAPLLAAHQLKDWAAWGHLLAAFVAFCLCASAVYLTNDLLDLEADRRHPRKSRRPLASGRLSIFQGVALVPGLLLLSLGSGALAGSPFLLWLLAYFSLTTAYSLGIKRQAILDCVALAMLYTLRIIAGGVAASVKVSFWLLIFSIFLFQSLAFVKRFAELKSQAGQGEAGPLRGRGYGSGDATLVQALGIASGYGAVLVLALYLNSDAVTQLYPHPEMIWGAVPIFLYWISWVWLKAHRGEMHDDPVVFAVRDPVSLLCGLAFALVVVAGAWPGGGSS